MSLSDKSVQEYKKIFKEEYGQDLTDAEAREQGERLVGFFDILYKQALTEHRRKLRLKKEKVKGFFLEASDGHYTCAICRHTHPGNEIWWNLKGLRCKDCWRNIKKRVIPSLTYDSDNKLWIKEWQLQSDYGLHPATRGKLRREGLLKGRDLKRKDGSIYCTVYLIKENQEFLKKYPKKPAMRVKYMYSKNNMSNQRKEVKEELVGLKNNDREYLHGDITFPEKPREKNPAVLLVHGFGVERTEGGMFSDLAYKLSSAGYLVFKFDFSGCGDSEGDYSETSLSKLKSDLKAMLNFVKKHPKVDRNKTGILAQSFGTAVTAALKPDVKAMVLMGSIAHPYELMKDLFKEDFNPNGISSRKRSRGNVTKVKPQFWKDFKDYDLLKNMSKMVYPILFIHGEKDDKIPVSEMWEYYHSKKGTKETDIEKGADHGLRPNREGVYLIVVDWFNKHLRK